MGERDARPDESAGPERFRPASRNEISGNVLGSVVQAASVQGGVHVHTASARAPVPAQLPAPRPHFTDREREMRALTELSDVVIDDGSPVVVVINGVGGVGKTSLALAWLHRIREGFADGQLFADLRGSPGDDPPAPTDPGEFLGRFLRALGVAAQEVPADAEEQAALFRSLTAGRRMIIMLDNAASAAQVRPLLPGQASVVVAVTSRRRLSGLAVDGASFLPLGPLEEDGAVRLLDRMLGSSRTGAEPEEARSLAELCGRLPLALCVSAARLATRRHWTIARLVAELADESGRLAALSDEEDTSVQAVFDVAYRDLPPGPARLYRLLSVHPGVDFDVPAAAAAAGTDAASARDWLETLVDANLLEAGTDMRYRFHDLARLHARKTADQAEPETDLSEAFGRLLEHYLTTAVAADRAVIPDRWHLGRYYQKSPVTSFADSTEAIGWLERELENLTNMVAAAHDRGLHRETWELCEALWGLFVFRKHYTAWTKTHRIGVAAAESCGDPRAQARMLEALASAYLNLRDFAEAARCSGRALELERSCGHLAGEASALERLGIAQLAGGDGPGAIETFTRALGVHRRIGLERGVAMTMRYLGEALAREGRPREAIERFTEALEFFTDRGDEYNRARTLTGLARALVAEEKLAEADETLNAALRAAGEVGARHEQASIHGALADIARRRGDPASERRHLERSVVIFEELGAPQAEEMRERLAGLLGPDARH